jgi:hypothetical protein
MLGLGPYSRAETLQIIQQLELRRNFPLTPAQRERLYEASGGHAGLILAFFSILIEIPQAIQRIGMPSWIEWLAQQPAVIEECRKIWDGLSEEEKEGLSAFARGEFNKISLPVEKLLFAKGLLQREDGEARFFSRIFEQYVRGLR